MAAETSETYPMQAGALRKGGFVMCDGKPCKIYYLSTVLDTGKHGHAKVQMFGRDIFTGRKYHNLFSSTHTMSVPFVKRTEYSLMHISEDDFASLFDDEAGEPKEDLKIPEDEVGERIRSLLEAGKDVVVSVIAAMGEEKIMDCKVVGEN